MYNSYNNFLILGLCYENRLFLRDNMVFCLQFPYRATLFRTSAPLPMHSLYLGSPSPWCLKKSTTHCLRPSQGQLGTDSPLSTELITSFPSLPPHFVHISVLLLYGKLLYTCLYNEAVTFESGDLCNHAECLHIIGT